MEKDDSNVVYGARNLCSEAYKSDPEVYKES